MFVDTDYFLSESVYLLLYIYYVFCQEGIPAKETIWLPAYVDTAVTDHLGPAS